MSEKTIGYKTDKPCDVCGGVKNNNLEPRFLYTVCDDHKDLTPIEVGKYNQPTNR